MATIVNRKIKKRDLRERKERLLPKSLKSRSPPPGIVLLVTYRFWLILSIAATLYLLQG